MAQSSFLIKECSLKVQPPWTTHGEKVWEQYLVKELKQFCTGLVNGADDGPATLGQSLHQRDHLETWCTIQATGEKPNKFVIHRHHSKPAHAFATRSPIIILSQIFSVAVSFYHMPTLCLYFSIRLLIKLEACLRMKKNLLKAALRDFYILGLQI